MMCQGMMPTMGLAAPIDEAVRKGLAISPEIRAEQFRESAAKTDVKIAKGGYYPALSISAGPRSFDLGGISYDVTASQMLLDWGRVASNVDSANAARRKVTEEMRAKREEVALDIVEVYLDILATERQVVALRAHLAKLDDVRTMASARSDGGYADRSEPERANFEIARANEQLAVDLGTLENAKNNYRLLVGEDPEKLIEPTPASMPAYLAGKDLNDIILKSPVYRSAVEDSEAAAAQVKQARSSLLPQLNLEASATRREIGGIPRSDTAVALRFRMNDLQGFSNILRPEGARQRLAAARFSEAQVERETRRDLRTLFDAIAMMRERETALTAQVAASDQVGATYSDQFRVGRRDINDLLNAQRERFDANNQLINVHIERLRAEYRAAARLGLLGPLLENGLN